MGFHSSCAAASAMDQIKKKFVFFQFLTIDNFSTDSHLIRLNFKQFFSNESLYAVSRLCIPRNIASLEELAREHNTNINSILNSKYTLVELAGAVVNLQELAGVRTR